MILKFCACLPKKESTEDAFESFSQEKITNNSVSEKKVGLEEDNILLISFVIPLTLK